MYFAFKPSLSNIYTVNENCLFPIFPFIDPPVVMCIITEKKEKGKKHWVSFFFVYNQYEFAE